MKRCLHGHPYELGCADCYGPFRAKVHSVSDGFGSTWHCRRNYLGPTATEETPCGLEVVRPGKVQCWCDMEDRQMSGTNEEKEQSDLRDYLAKDQK